jgi:hypothetical protein
MLGGGTSCEHLCPMAEFIAMANSLATRIVTLRREWLDRPRLHASAGPDVRAADRRAESSLKGPHPQLRENLSTRPQGLGERDDVLLSHLVRAP